MKLSFKANIFTAYVDYEERKIAKEAGFFWNPALRVWQTSLVSVASKLKNYADESALVEIEKKVVSIEPWKFPITYPQNLKPREYQLEAARFALARSRAYLALDPGLGKTIIAAMIASTLHEKTVYICPPFLIENTFNEFRKWAPILFISKIDSIDFKNDHVLLVPDSLTHKESVQDKIIEFLGGAKDSTCFYDESHRIKEATAQRSKAFYNKIAPLFKRVYLMSGTPMPNRPMELYAPLHNFAPDCIDHKNKFEFGVRYCAAFKGTWGWDFNGSSNMQELSDKLKTYMLRLRKDEVLKELPPKTEEVIFIGDALPQKLSRIDKEIIKAFSPSDLMKSTIALMVGKEGSELHISTYRKELGMAKIKHSVTFIEHLLESTKDSILIFAIHKGTIAALTDELEAHKPIVVVGDTKMNDRAKNVAAFQRGDSRLFIGNIQAAGTGFTLTKATRVVFVEFGWTPGENIQAMDRAHRIGQHENVIVQYLVFKNSVDAQVIQTILKKKEVISYV